MMINIPASYLELEYIYSATLARDIKSLAVVSTSPGEGVSSIILSLAKRNALAGRKTLVVDFNIYHPELSALTQVQISHSTSRALPAPTTLITSREHSNIDIISVPIQRDLVLGLREPGVLQKSIKQWLENYDNVLIDTSPMSLTNRANLPPEYISSACDGTILTVLAGRTTRTALVDTLAKLSKAQALLLGTVINDQFNPSLKDELLREIQRLAPFFPRLAKVLAQWIKNRKILALAV